MQLAAKLERKVVLLILTLLSDKNDPFSYIVFNSTSFHCEVTIKDIDQC